MTKRLVLQLMDRFVASSGYEGTRQEFTIVRKRKECLTTSTLKYCEYSLYHNNLDSGFNDLGLSNNVFL